jgi:hypothetical protein
MAAPGAYVDLVDSIQRMSENLLKGRDVGGAMSPPTSPPYSRSAPVMFVPRIGKLSVNAPQVYTSDKRKGDGRGERD